MDSSIQAKDKPTLYQFDYRLELKGEAVFRSNDGDPNLVGSEGFIPGSTVWGALGESAIQRRKLTYESDMFRELFLEGGLRCLNGYPIKKELNENTDEVEEFRLLPCPLSLRRKKPEAGQEVTDLFDFAAYGEAELKNSGLEEQSLQDLKGEFVYLQNQQVYQGQVRRRYNYHTTRKDNRRAGRATQEDGQVFVYQALQPGQTFLGRLLVEESYLTIFREIFGEGEMRLALGRSRATQYGGNASLTLGAARKYEREVNGANTDKGITRLVVTLLSPLLARSSSGFNTLAFPLKALALAINRKEPPRLNLKAGYARPVVVGGYSAAWRMPGPQWVGLAAGSVFIIESNSAVSMSDFSQIEAYGLGWRTGEGFGRFALNWHGSAKELRLDVPPRVEAAHPKQVPTQLSPLVGGLVRAEWLRQAEQAALREAESFEKNLGVVSPALLNRLQTIIRDDFEQAATYLAEPGRTQDEKQHLRPLARQQLERLYYTNQGRNRVTLLSHLQEILAANSESSSLPYISNYRELQGLLQPTGWQPDVALRRMLAKNYALTLLEQLSRRRRAMGD